MSIKAPNQTVDIISRQHYNEAFRDYLNRQRQEAIDRAIFEKVYGATPDNLTEIKRHLTVTVLDGYEIYQIEQLGRDPIRLLMFNGYSIPSPSDRYEGPTMNVYRLDGNTRTFLDEPTINSKRH